jgi:hypothetical protein
MLSDVFDGFLLKLFVFMLELINNLFIPAVTKRFHRIF